MLEYKDRRSLVMGSLVKVYLNWNKGTDIYSIVDTASGLVVAYSNNITLTDCKFHVSESGRQRVHRDQRKNVHAYIVGTLHAVDVGKPSDLPMEVFYDPYKTDLFRLMETGEPVATARRGHCSNRRVWIEEPNTLFFSKREGIV